jgi:hypothetical protein
MLSEDPMECGTLVNKMATHHWKCLKDNEIAERVSDILVYAFDRYVWRVTASFPKPRYIGKKGINEKDTGEMRLLFYCFRVRGIEFFWKASQKSWLSVRFAFLYRHLARDPEKYDNPLSFRGLYIRSSQMRSGVERRYLATVFEPNYTKLNSVKILGCSYRQCPQKKRLSHLAKKIHGPEDWELVSVADKKATADWGHTIKFCSR